VIIITTILYLFGVMTVQTASDDKGSGMVMTIALTIEMAFLALSFSGALKNHPAYMKAFGAAIGPFALLLGGFVSCWLRSEAWHVVMDTFCNMACLLLFFLLSMPDVSIDY
jgi:hypothetical protein